LASRCCVTKTEAILSLHRQSAKEKLRKGKAINLGHRGERIERPPPQKQIWGRRKMATIRDLLEGARIISARKGSVTAHGSGRATTP